MDIVRCRHVHGKRLHAEGILKGGERRPFTPPSRVFSIAPPMVPGLRLKNTIGLGSVRQSPLGRFVLSSNLSKELARVVNRYSDDSAQLVSCVNWLGIVTNLRPGAIMIRGSCSALIRVVAFFQFRDF